MRSLAEFSQRESSYKALLFQPRSNGSRACLSAI